MHAYIEDNKLIEYPIDNIRNLFPEASLPVNLTDDALLPEGYVYVNSAPFPEYDRNTHKIEAGCPIKLGDRWFVSWNILVLSETEVEQRLQAKRQSMVVTPFQAKAALLDAGLLGDIETLIADPATDRKVVLAWNNVQNFERLSPMITGIATALGWSNEQLDALFEAASQIK
jgi:hypothetical protein